MKTAIDNRIRAAAVLLSVLTAAGSLSACGGLGEGEGKLSELETENSGWTFGPVETVTDADGNPVTQAEPASQTDPATSAEPDTLPEPETAEEPETGVVDTSDCTASVTLAGSTASVTGSGVTVNGSTVTFTKAGTYLLTGTLEGQLVVDTQDEEKVKLILNGVSVNNPDGPAVYAVNAPKKLILYSAEGSVNLFSDGSGYVVAEEAQTEGVVYPNACIYARADLKLDGKGVLQVTGNADKGINTSDDLEIAGGTVTVTSKGVGIRGNDSVDITDGSITVTSGGDGIKTAQTEKEGKGCLTVSGGTLSVTATGDTLNAAVNLTVTGGVLVLTANDAAGSTQKSSSSGSYGGRGGFGGGGFGGDGNSNKPSISCKGLKAAGTITVSGGRLTVTSADDGIHANDTVLVENGTVWISAGDDGIHADKVLTISGGVTEITKSYEGLEADKINVMGGTNRITASDDGMNASNGESTGGMGGFRPGGRGSTTTDANAPLLTIGGGYTIVNAGGDGIDSNGNIVMTGGIMIVYGPTDNGNGPIDFGDGNYDMKISGGTLLAIGSSGMAESPTNNGQAAWAARCGNITAGTLVGLADADGNIICGFKTPKNIASFVYSSPALTAGSSYTFIKGGDAQADADGFIDLSSWSGYSTVGSVDAY